MENALLRQQLIVASRKVKRPIFTPLERGFVVSACEFSTSLAERPAVSEARHGTSLAPRDINSRRVVHVSVTRSPTAESTAQQLRNITPFGEGPQFIIRDNDNKFGAQFDRVAKGAGMKVLRTAIQAPLQNSICERFIGSARRECLDHVIILGRSHMKHVLEQYGIDYFNARCRPHQGIARQNSSFENEREIYRKGTKITSVPVLGGLHHDYQVAA